MNFKLILLLFLWQNTFVFSQDGAFWGYSFSIQFESLKPIDSNDSIVSLELYKNSNHISKSQGSTQCSFNLLSHDLDSAFFVVAEGCSFIGSSPTKIKPPTIILRFGIRRKVNNGSSINYFKIIPIVFDEFPESFAVISLFHVEINHFSGIPSDDIVIKVVSKNSYEIIEQESLEVKPVINTLLRFE